MARLPPSAQTTTDEAGHLVATDFNDTYFSRDDGLEESRLVFLKGNHLPDAWSEKSVFVIGELGFGSGLNVLATWDLWNQTKPKAAILHIISFEGFLLDADAARAIHARWPELEPLSQKLIARWPTRSYGSQRLWFPEDRICVTIVIGQCAQTLPQMRFQADCWFLDGFAPSKNPDMWSPSILDQVVRLSKSTATLATYSVAGPVRRHLEAVGFEVQRVDGFGSKRQRLEARRVSKDELDSPQSAPKSAIVIGGGIGGSAMCAALTKRGLHVDLFDADPCGRYKASGNPIALIAPRLDRGDTREGRFYRSAYLLACDTYSQMDELAFARVGVIERSPTPQDQKRLADLARDPPLAGDHLIGHEDDSALLHLKGGVAYPDEVLKSLQRDCVRHPVAIAALERREGQWWALSETGKCLAKADLCVVAAGTGFKSFVDLGDDLRARAGQLSYIRTPELTLDHAICGGAYAAQSGQNLFFGATFEAWPLEDQTPPPVSSERHAHNLTILSEIAPELASEVDVSGLSGRGSIRVTTPDHLPLAGKAPGDQEGLFVLAGLGSRGFTTAFLCAEIIAARALNEPEPVAEDLVEALRPDRFLERAKRKKVMRPSPIN
jgi:tRNA 5-methylaminomethyl-2-thiouridine biosynthesis bifunctional protein